MHTGNYILLALTWRVKLMNRLRIEGEKNYLRERSIALCNYKEIVWITLETATNLVKHAMRFVLFNASSTPNHCIQWNLNFLSFQKAY